MIATSHTRSYRLKDAWMTNTDGVTKTEQLVVLASCGTDEDQARRAERALSAADDCIDQDLPNTALPGRHSAKTKQQRSNAA
jgi:hypothetical protein